MIIIYQCKTDHKFWAIIQFASQSSSAFKPKSNTLYAYILDSNKELLPEVVNRYCTSCHRHSQKDVGLGWNGSARHHSVRSPTRRVPARARGSLYIHSDGRSVLWLARLNPSSVIGPFFSFARPFCWRAVACVFIRGPRFNPICNIYFNILGNFVFVHRWGVFMLFRLSHRKKRILIVRLV